MTVAITSIAAGSYAPLTVGGVTQPAPSAGTCIPLYSQGGPRPAAVPLLLPTDTGAPGRLVVGIHLPDGVKESLGATVMVVTATWNDVTFRGQWGPFTQSSDTTYDIEIALTPSGEAAADGFYRLAGPLRFVLTDSGGMDIPLGSYPLEIYTGPNPGAAPGQGTDLRTLRQWVARDMAARFSQDRGSAMLTAGACAQGAFLAPPYYASSQSYYTFPALPPTAGDGNFALAAWLFANTGLNPSPTNANCYDSTAMCCLMLALQPRGDIVRAWGGDISPFGDLVSPATQMIRGVPNNPPPPQKPIPGFGDHMVMVVDWNATDYYVADGCIGPHLANETTSQYLQNTVTDPSYPQSAWNKPPPGGFSEQSLYLPTQLDGEPFTPATSVLIPTPQRFLANHAAFAAAMGMPELPQVDAREVAGAFVVKGAPSLPAGCPALETGFVVVHEHAMYGWPVSDKRWVLSDGARAVTLRIWVSSDGTAPAQRRFLHEGAATSEEVRFRPAADGPGAACAVLQGADGKAAEVLWTSGGRVCRLIGPAPGLDLMALARAVENAPTQPRRPVIRGVKVAPSEVAVGETVTVEVDADGDWPLEIFGVRALMRLVHGDGRRLTLKAEQAGRVEAGVVVTDPVSLLSDRAAAAITIGEAASATEPLVEGEAGLRA